MKKEEKIQLVEELSEKVAQSKNFYITDVSELTVNQTTELRKLCYDNEVELKTSKNTFIKKALRIAKIENEDLFDVLAGPSSIMFSETANAPAKLIKEFRKKNKKPLLKAAFIEEYLYVGDENLEALASLKSKEELIADVMALLGSPIKNLLSALDGGQKIMSVLQTLENKEE